MTLLDVKNRVFNDTLRTDAAFAGEFPSFVQLAEQRIFWGGPQERVRVRDMETTEDISITSGDGDLPDRYLEPISAVWVAGTTSTEPLLSAPREIHLRRAADPSTGPARLYTIEGGKVRVWPANTGTLRLTYSRAYAPLVADADTNWIVGNASAVYIHAILIEAYRYLRDAEKYQASIQEYLRAVAGLRSADSRSRFTATSIRRTSAFA